MIEVIPALMPEDFEDINAFAKEFKGLVGSVQLDIMDGKFVPESTWPYNGNDEYFSKLAEESEGLPFWSELDYEIDLMIADPKKDFEKWRHVGARRLIVHIESLEDPEEFFALPFFGEMRTEFLETGIALNIDTPNETIDPYMDKIDFVQCMGIARIGYQGEPFDERVLHKINSLREAHPELIISIDGGVNLETAPKLISAGANRLVSGSAILESENPVEIIHALQNPQ